MPVARMTVARMPVARMPVARMPVARMTVARMPVEYRWLHLITSVLRLHHGRKKLFINRARLGLIGEICFVLSNSGKIMIGEILFVLSDSGNLFRERMNSEHLSSERMSTTWGAGVAERATLGDGDM